MGIGREILRCVTLILLLACVVSSATEPPEIPKTFSTDIGGFMGSSYSVELHNGVLTYTSSGFGHSNPKRESFTPTTAQWREFRQALDDLKVWQWRSRYPNNGTADGTQWSVKIIYTDRRLHAHGDNNYPDVGGKPSGSPDPPKSFERYLAAVQQLLGGKNFR
jgi:hypothetical protein